jgi:hypothetical protein
VARSSTSLWRLASGKVLSEISRGAQGGVGQGGGGMGSPERWADSEAVQMASGGSVERRQGSSGGCRRVWRGLVAQGRPGGEDAAVD